MIDVRDVAKSHLCGQTTVQALRGVTCSIPEGVFTFILGPSGSGKSTLMHLIGALDDPTQGDILIAGRSLKAMTPREKDEYRRSDVGFIFQNFNLISNLNAVQNVLVPFLPAGAVPAQHSRAIEMLQRVGLGERLDHRPAQLSGGEQQRVAIARALLKRPRLILADEPTGELDSTTSETILGLLRQLSREEGATVIIVTHEQQLVHEGDHVVRIRDGRVVTTAA